MDFKLVLLLVVFSVIAFQESSATFRLPQFRLPQFRLPQFRLPQFRLPQFRLPTFRLRADRDVEINTDENKDGFLDEAELAKYLSERDIAELMEALDDDGDKLISVDEFTKN